MTKQILGIVADDLTGAMDSSGYFARLGLGTVVILDPDFPSAADVVVVNTNSRAEDPGVARGRVKKAVRSLAGRVVYKKIDSTLRGNIGVELEAAMVETDSEKVIVAPAFPAVGRTTVAGVLLVDGMAVAETQFADDPISPVRESHIPTLLEEITGDWVGSIGVADIMAGPESLYRRINRMSSGIIVCDVTRQSHLTGIVQAAALAKGHWLLCGSGGLARELHLLIGELEVGKVKPSKQPAGPVLVAVGSRNQVAANQLRKAEKEFGLPVLNLEVEYQSQEDIVTGRIDGILAEASRLLEKGKGLAVSSTFSRYTPALKQSIPILMGEVVTGLLVTRKFAGLFLSGGDIAVEVCRRLSVVAISVLGEVEPGVPAGEMMGGPSAGMRVVTKAGGFGTEEALVKSMAYLEKGYLS